MLCLYSEGQLENHSFLFDASSSLAASPHTCLIACLQLWVLRGWCGYIQIRAKLWAAVHCSLRVPHAFFAWWSEITGAEDKAIKKSRALRHDKRWLYRICEWIRETSTWMTTCEQEQWMNLTEEVSYFTASPDVWRNSNSRESEITSYLNPESHTLPLSV